MPLVASGGPECSGPRSPTRMSIASVRCATTPREPLRRAGFEIEPDFRPHLTLGRARRLPPGAGREALERWYAVWKDHEFGPLPVESVHLMRSQLARGPARHSRVASLELQ